MSNAEPQRVAAPTTRAPSRYVPAVGPKLKIVLAILFALVAALGATGVYLAAISLLNWLRDPQTYTNSFTLWVFIAHTGVGILAIAPFLFFGVYHLITARKRPNRYAVKLGLMLFFAGILVIISGLALIQLEGLPQLPTGTWSRSLMYWAHIVLPLMAIGLYVQHRRAGPDIQWKWGIAWGVGVSGFVAVMIGLHSANPRAWYAVGSPEGEQYFHPSLARTSDGNFISAQVLMADKYCMKCHEDIYKDHLHSAHRFSSFNNPPYLFSVRETRKISLERDGNVKAARWCAGCHDPAPFFSGAFDDPNFDDVSHPTAHAGITCTVCHAITNVNSTVGNADYTIEEPEHYPFAFSENRALQWINNQLIKAKPDFHKRTFLKPFHQSANGNVASEFCSTCHKVSLPLELNHYKEFLRGQNHYDSFLLSGVSGHGARSFYYPPEAKTNCNDCHMPLKPSGDFGSKDRDGSGIAKVHDHFFPGANTGLPFLVAREDRYRDWAPGLEQAIQRNRDFLTGTDPEGKDKKLRIDIFGIKNGGTIDGELTALLGPKSITLKPGGKYLVEVVVRTLGVGHHFSQGTVDSNEIWVDFEAKSGKRVIARNGGLANPDDSGEVDPWAHFINVHMLDRDGNRINRRNPQDIFTPLYDHQIPPGAANVIHYQLEVPEDVTESITLSARVRYRKFDYEYMKLVHGDRPVPKLPIVDMCSATVQLPVLGSKEALPPHIVNIPEWQRWNDYGIACFIEGGLGMKKGELRQAEAAFREMLKLDAKDGTGHAYVNLARLYFDEGRMPEATDMLARAQKATPPPPWWTLAWFNALVTAENATEPEVFDRAIRELESIIDPKNQPTERKFNFALDYIVLNKLANTYYRRAQVEIDDPSRQSEFYARAITTYEKTLALDSEDLDAHYWLNQCYARVGINAPETTRTIPNTPTSEQMLGLIDRLRDRQLAASERVETAAELAGSIIQFGKLAPDPKRPRLPTLQALIRQLRPLYQNEQNVDVRIAMANVMAQLHRETHSILRPDELARSLTTAKYRAKHPAANHAAEAIVIYPTTATQRDAILKKTPSPAEAGR